MSFLRLAAGYLRLKKPKNLAHLLSNQSLRQASAIEYLTNHLIKGRDVVAVKQFWAMQTLFFIQFLITNHHKLYNLFPNIIPEQLSFSKKELDEILMGLVAEIERHENQAALQGLLRLFIDDSHAAINSSKMTVEASEPPVFQVQTGDSIKFACEQAHQGKKVLLMDAANAQRPGAAAHKKGTYQEALTRSTDLYWKMLADFRHVLKDHSENNSAVFNVTQVELDGINVTDYQLNFLQLMLHFVQKILVQPDYVTSKDFIYELHTYANGVYSKMQNIVFEIPANGGFLKNVNFANTDNIVDMASLFDQDGVLNKACLAEEGDRFLIVEVAAPDKRSYIGEYDRCCTNSLALSNSNDEKIAVQILSDSISFTLQKAIENEVDIILLNAFGCGAFENDPVEVAKVFASTLLMYADSLQNKKVIFMDLNPGMCSVFNQVFSEILSNKFKFNATSIGEKIQLNLLQANIKTTLDQDEVMIIGRNSKIGKSSNSSAEGSNVIKQILIPGLSKLPKTIEALEGIYLEYINQAINIGKKVIYLPLIGTGGLNFSTEISAAALINALEVIAKTVPDKEIKINLCIPEHDKYSIAMKLVKASAEEIEEMVPSPSSSRP